MTTSPTICAIATGNGGAIALIRVSGAEAITITEKIAFLNKGKLSDLAANEVRLALIKEQDILVDEVMIATFKAPRSFTGENMVEISCHASKFVQQRIIQLLLANGARLATAGEFTQRAFVNGKMDLSQAEAIADLIASSSAASHKIAMQQMRGGFSKELIDLRDKLLQFTSLMELELDFSEEEVEFADREQLRALVDGIEAKINSLASSFSLGNAIKNGVPVAIVGETNVGKSTLLNYLLNDEKAIVSDIHGTTRDVIEDTVNLQGILFRFIDTAGIRETKDVVENLGIERTFQKIEQADVVLLMVDATKGVTVIQDSIAQLSAYIAHKKVILVCNKIDLLTADEAAKIQNTQFEGITESVFISAKQQQNTAHLHEALIHMVELEALEEDAVVVSNLRHYEALTQALQAIRRVQSGLQNHLAGDFISQDIRECLHYLGEITGSISTDEVLGNIFMKFCIGK